MTQVTDISSWWASPTWTRSSSSPSSWPSGSSLLCNFSGLFLKPYRIPPFFFCNESFPSFLIVMIILLQTVVWVAHTGPLLWAFLLVTQLQVWQQQPQQQSGLSGSYYNSHNNSQVCQVLFTKAFFYILLLFLWFIKKWKNVKNIISISVCNSETIIFRYIKSSKREETS